MVYLFIVAESLGCTNRSELLKVQDNSANTPLHSAVNGGDTKVGLVSIIGIGSSVAQISLNFFFYFRLVL